jgi:hypothetical protein
VNEEAVIAILIDAEERGTPNEETSLHWADVERPFLRVNLLRERSSTPSN